MSRESTTTDLKVLQGWPLQTVKMAKKKTTANQSPAVCCTAGQVAEALGLTPFQITARLKGMEGRGFIERDKAGLWSMTESGLAERANPSASMTTVKVKRALNSAGVASGAPDDSKVPHVSFKERKKGWTYRRDRTLNLGTIAINPDGQEYVNAKRHEAADLILDLEDSGTFDQSMFPPARYRLLATSAAQKKANKELREERIRAIRESEKSAARAAKREIESPTTPVKAAKKKTKSLLKKKGGKKRG